MAKKTEQPEYIASALNTPMLNYRVYVMGKQEKLLTFLVAFLAGGALALLFYGGQFRDADGAATTATLICNVILFVVVGLIAAKVILPIRCEMQQQKRKRELTQQFRSLLEALAVSLSSGMNMTEALRGAYNDLKVEYSEDAYIVAEVKEMIEGVENNIPIENMMLDFGERSEIEDIKNFGTVFELCYRAGGNMKDIVRRTSSIISEKIEITAEIETKLASNKSQFTLMLMIPVLIMAMLKMMSSDFAASFSTVAGVIAITIAMGMFFAAYKWANKIMDVKG